MTPFRLLPVLLAMPLTTLLAACAAPRPDPRAADQFEANQFEAGLRAYDGQRYEEAAITWQTAALLGDAAAARNLGHLYRWGLAVEEDAGLAADWYRRAAEGGLGRAAYNLGALYLKGGPGLAPDPLQAVRWLERARELGVAQAGDLLERAGAPLPPEP